MAAPLLLIALAIILASAELFTNGVEWFGRRYELGEGAVGSILAAVGTALPETLVPIIAIVFTGGQAAASSRSPGTRKSCAVTSAIS
jgi:cation:H+ antiporter